MALTKVQICNMALSKIGNERNQLADATFSSNTGSTFNQCNLHYEQTLKELVRMHSWNCCKARSEIGAYKINLTPSATILANGGFSGNLTATSTDSNGRPVYTTGTSGSNGYINLAFNDTAGKWSITYGASNANNVANAFGDGATYTGHNPWTQYGGAYTLVIVKPKFEYDNSYRIPTDAVRLLYLTNDSGTYFTLKPRVDYIVEGNSILNNHDESYLCYTAEPDPANMDSLFGQAFITLLAARMAIPITGDVKMYQILLQEFNSVIMPEARRTNAFEKLESPIVDSEWLESTLTSSSSYNNSFPPFSQTSYGSFE